MNFIKIPITGDGVDLDTVTLISYSAPSPKKEFSTDQAPRVVLHMANYAIIVECDSVDTAIAIRDELIEAKIAGHARAKGT